MSGARDNDTETFQALLAELRRQERALEKVAEALRRLEADLADRPRVTPAE